MLDLDQKDDMGTLQRPADILEASRRVEAAAALLARGLLGLAPITEAAEAATIWLGQAETYLQRAA